MSPPIRVNGLTGYTINNYYLTKILGSGASGTVYHARHLHNHQIFAIKVVAKKSPGPSDKRNDSPESTKEIQANRIPVSPDSTYHIYKSHFNQTPYKEVMIHSAVHAHANIVGIIEVLDSHDFISVVLEYCNTGDLFGALTEKNWYVGDKKVAKVLLLQLLDAVEYCHSRSVFHCDLKPENILVDHSGARLKLADFGLASTTPLCKEFGRGSSYYMGPENIASNIKYRKRSSTSGSSSQDRRRSDGTSSNTGTRKSGHLQSKGFPKSASDVWALGIIFLNLLFGRNPWKTACLRTDAAYRDYAKNHNTLKAILPVSEELNHIMSLVFHPDPYQRLSIARFRERVLACQIFISHAKDFPWFKRTTITTPISLFEPSSNNLEPKITDIFYEATQVHIENLKEHSIEVSSITGVRPVLKPPKVRVVAGDVHEIYTPTHVPSVISPPLSDESLQFSDCITGSTVVSERSIVTHSSASSTSLKSKRKITNFKGNNKSDIDITSNSNSNGTPLESMYNTAVSGLFYPATPEKSYTPSPTYSSSGTTKYLFNSKLSELDLFSFESGYSKRLRSKSLLPEVLN